MKVNQALIVDDSKTARVTLRKMLDKHSIEVAMVESGEEALEYLQEHQPNVIFMDHMMPGMDGFAAVKAIKADPEMSSIPIVMHTTKQGDIYVGQARALGAVDILRKPATDRDLIDVLERVRQHEAKKEPVPAAGTSEVIAVNDSMLEQSYASSIPDSAVRAEPGVASAKQAPPAYTPVAVPVSVSESPPAPARQWLSVALMLASIAWLLSLYLPAQQQIQSLQDERKVLYQALQWAVNDRESFDYGEPPMSADRLTILRSLVGHLSNAGFTGTIRLEGHVGEFCLSPVSVGGGRTVNMLPKANLPLTACATIGTSVGQALAYSVRQSNEFRSYLANSELLSSQGIAVELVPFGGSSPAYEYPVDLEGVTVGDWNRIALSNNRVNFILIPD